MKKTNLILLVMFGLLSSPLQADFFGLANGRTASMDNMADLSVEAGMNIKTDFSTYGARVNYKMSRDFLLFGDLGRSSFGDADGFTFGGGGFYQLRNVTLLDNTDLAVKGSFHTGTLESDVCDGLDLFGLGEFCDSDVKVSEITLEVLLSGDQLATTDLAWYANAGFHMLENSNEIGLGAGVVGNLSFGDWFVGVDFIDQFFVVGGIRYNVR